MQLGNNSSLPDPSPGVCVGGGQGVFLKESNQRGPELGTPGITKRGMELETAGFNDVCILQWDTSTPYITWLSRELLGKIKDSSLEELKSQRKSLANHTWGVLS